MQQTRAETRLHPVAIAGAGESRAPRVALGHILLAGFLLTAGVLVVTLVSGPANLRRVYGTSAALAHTYAVKARLDQLLSTLIDAETGERGFVITGAPEYLEPYNQALDQTAFEMTDLRSLTGDNPAQQADLAHLATLVEIKRAELADVIQARRAQDLSAAQAVVETNVEKRTMDAMRAIVARMAAREEALSDTWTTRAERSYRVARATQVASSALALLGLAALFVLTRRLGVERRLAVDSAARLRVTLEGIGEGVISTDNQGRVSHINAVAQALCGWSADDAVGARLGEVFVVGDAHDDHGGPNVERMAEEAGQADVTAALRPDAALRAKDGRVLPIEASAAAIRAVDGRTAGLVVVFRDVTQRRRVEEERERARTELEVALRAREDFLAVASHELRNPVHAVHLHLAGLLQAFAGGAAGLPLPVLRERLERTQVQVGHLTRLLNNLLDVSRLNGGALVLQPEDLVLQDVVQSVIDQFRVELGPEQLSVRAAVDPVVGRWDRLRLEQVIANLLSNAMKYGRGQPIEIELGAERDTARVSVVDRGIGIGEQERKRLFGRFERGAASREYAGFGLGLWITRQIVESMGGAITVESRVGLGSTFSVVLPLGGGEPRPTS